MRNEARHWTTDGDQTTQFKKKLGIIQIWKDRIYSLNTYQFIRRYEVKCRVLFNQNAKVTLTLLSEDQTPTLDDQPRQQKTQNTLLIVTCGSPFSISVGAGFSTIANREFAIVKSVPAPGGTTSVNQFGTTADSKINPYPIVMAHARIYDWDEHRYGLHFSFGVGANIKGQNSGGSNPEFLTGLSLSLFRIVYLTGGLDIGKQSKLSGGFKVGNTVPTDITTPPVSSSYKPGFGFAVKFTKP